MRTHYDLINIQVFCGLDDFLIHRAVFNHDTGTNWAQTMSALFTMGVAVLWTVGLMGWLGWPRDAIHEVLLPLILVVGACDAMHLLARQAEHVPDSGE